MFRRRRPLRPHEKLREFVWPRAGWRRWGLYLWRRVTRTAGTPHRMAAGLAAGASVSCMPLPGLHFLLALGLAWATRGSLLAAMVGTAFGNPWTFPLLWGAAYRLGGAVAGGRPATDEEVAEDIAEEAGGLLRALISLDVDPGALAASFLPVWLPTMLGSLPIAAGVWVAAYALARAAAPRRTRRGEGRGGAP